MCISSFYHISMEWFIQGSNISSKSKLICEHRLRSFDSAHIVLSSSVVIDHWTYVRYSLDFIAPFYHYYTVEKGRPWIGRRPFFGGQKKFENQNWLYIFYQTRSFCLPLHSYFILNRQDFLTCQMVYVSTINFWAAYLHYISIGRENSLRGINLNNAIIFYWWDHVQTIIINKKEHFKSIDPNILYLWGHI